ncbi:MAG: RNA polymerase factor sigma-54 [Clostridiales bacterium]|nr:RNA polymerase factor sigma-54 [Clostridiales bacterium]MDY4172551.1 RNA polymerase factor sigma-54 [Evtepia sp.]
MDVSQGMELAQALKLSPTLLQSMGILQMNTLELAGYLKELALENPVMEYDEAGEGLASWESFASQVPWLGDTAGSAGGEPVGEPGRMDSQTESLEFLLEEQLERLELGRGLLAVCKYLVGLLDERGWLAAEDLEELVETGVPRGLLEQGVETLQGLDPAGVGARSLGECLALQLGRLPGDHGVALAICAGHLDLLGAEQYGALARKLGVSLEQVRAAAREIRGLDPDPVGSLTPPPVVVEYVRPDAWVAEIDGELKVFVNQWDLPQFHLSDQYLRLAKAGQEEETAVYLRQKIQQARWVLACVRRRQETLEKCLTALVKAQEDYFWGRQEAPGPLLRRELAEGLEVHPSTVTRTLRHKYIQCRQGMFSTAWFFARRTGPGEQSAQRVKARIARAVKEEDPERPLSDQALTEMLAGEGMVLARRTVAKYRQAMGVPAGYRRKRGK